MEPLVSSARGTKWYGGYQARSLDTTAFGATDSEFSNNTTLGDSFQLRFQSAGAAGSSVQAVFYVDKADFLSTASKVPVSFDATSRLKLGNVTAFENLGSLRWLVREGTAFFVSEAIFSGAAELTFASAADDGRWAAFDPATDLNFSAATAVYSSRNFQNLTAFGFIIDRDAAPPARVYLDFRDMEVLAAFSTTPSSPPTLYKPQCQQLVPSAATKSLS